MDRKKLVIIAIVGLIVSTIAILGIRANFEMSGVEDSDMVQVTNSTLILVTKTAKVFFDGWGSTLGSGPYLIRQTCRLSNHNTFDVYNVTVVVKWPNGTESDLIVMNTQYLTSTFNLTAAHHHKQGYLVPEQRMGYIKGNPEDLLIEIVRAYGYYDIWVEE